MIPYPYNMVDMGGIDLAEANHTVVPGIYQKITDAMNACGDMVLYNWYFCEIPIQPGHLTALQTSGGILINGLIQVTELDEISVLGIAPPPPPVVPVEPITITENGIYTAVEPASGFNPVTVQVPPTPQDVIISDEPPSPDVGNIGQYYIYMETVFPDTIGITLTKVARGTNYDFTYWGTNGIIFFLEDAEGNEVASNEITGIHAYLTSSTLDFQQRDQLLNYNNNYSERSGLNGYFKFVFPSQLAGYKVKKIRVWVRQNSSYYDFWRTFSIATWSSDRVEAQAIVRKENLVQSDWSFTTYTDIELQTPVELSGTIVYSLYQKTVQGWVLLT